MLIDWLIPMHSTLGRTWVSGPPHTFSVFGPTVTTICEAGRPNQCHVGNFRHVFFYIFGKGSYSALQSAKN